MAGISATDAALEGVRLIRAKPKVVLLWALYYFAFLLILEFIAYLTLGGHMSELLAAMRDPPTEPTASERLIHTVTPFIVIAGSSVAVFQAMFTAAIYRNILRPDDPRAGLRLGLDELRLLAVFGLLMVVLMAMIFVDKYLILVTASLPDNMFTVAFVALAVVASWSVVVVVLVRLSLLGAATIARKRFAFEEGWRLTAGQFTRLLGAYVMATVLSVVLLALMNFVVGVVFGLVRHLVAPMVGGGGATLAASLVLEAIVALIVAGSYVVLLAPPAAAYAALTDAATEPA